MHASSVCPELPLLRFQIMKVTIAPTVILLEVGVGGCQPTRGMLDCLLVGLGLRSLLVWVCGAQLWECPSQFHAGSGRGRCCARHYSISLLFYGAAVQQAGMLYNRIRLT